MSSIIQQSEQYYDIIIETTEILIKPKYKIMKKLLLTIASVAMAIAASATDYTLFDIANKGTWTEEGTGFKWTDGEFTITTDKGSYNSNLVSPIAYDFSWRVYKGSNFTITSKTVDMKSVVITYDDYVYNGTDYVGPMSFGEGWTGAISDHTYTINNAAGSKTFTASPYEKQVRIKKLIVSTEVKEGGDTPNPPAEGVTFVKATTLETGSYVFVCDGKIGTPASASATFGRIALADATIDGDNVKTDAKNAFEITVADGKATIKDAEGRFYSMDNEHLSNFQFYKDENQYNYWTFAFDGDKVKFTNAVNTDCFICQSKGDKGTFYTNIAPAKAPTEFNLPVLYKKADGSGVANIAVENNGEAVYYNLQGVRVENPVKGLYIVVKGGKSQKVMF